MSRNKACTEPYSSYVLYQTVKQNSCQILIKEKFMSNKNLIIGTMVLKSAIQIPCQGNAKSSDPVFYDLFSVDMAIWTEWPIRNFLHIK